MEPLKPPAALSDEMKALMAATVPNEGAPGFPEKARVDKRKPRRRGLTFVRIGEKVGRNDPCPCGSGVKFKRCCSSTAPIR